MGKTEFSSTAKNRTNSALLGAISSMKSGPHLKLLRPTTYVVYLGFHMKHFEIFRMYICCDCGSHLLKMGGG